MCVNINISIDSCHEWDKLSNKVYHEKLKHITKSVSKYQNNFYFKLNELDKTCSGRPIGFP